MIDMFVNENRFLSNFYPADLVYGGLLFMSSESAYQASKCKNVDDRKLFLSLHPSEAKRLGRKVEIRDDWDKVKDEVMLAIVRIKFSKESLKQKLLATGEEELVEGNYWHDNYWGDCSCAKCRGIKGRNKLGRILMQVRSELRDERK